MLIGYRDVGDAGVVDLLSQQIDVAAARSQADDLEALGVGGGPGGDDVGGGTASRSIIRNSQSGPSCVPFSSSVSWPPEARKHRD